MKKLTFILFFATIFQMDGQSPLKKMYIVDIQGENVIQGKQFIYQLKDSTISFVPYKHIGKFYKKTPRELEELDIQVEFGELDFDIQEISVKWIDEIAISSRTARRKNTFMGLGFGALIGVTSAAVIYGGDRNNPEVQSWVIRGFWLGAGMTGLGGIVGSLLPTAKWNIRIGRNKEQYQKKHRSALEDFTILKY